MELSEVLLEWISKRTALQGPVSFSDGKIQLSDLDTERLARGELFVPLLKSQLEASHSEEIPDFSSMRSDSSTATSLHNWNVLIPVFSKLNITIDADFKALILGGDDQSLRSLLDSLFRMSEQSESRPKRKKKNPGTIMLEKIDQSKDLEDSDNCLEFLVLSFCMSFDLSPKQSAGLLTENAKFLSYVLQSGIKGNFQPVLKWLQLVDKHLGILVALIKDEIHAGALDLVLNALAGGIESKNIQCASSTFMLYVDIYEKLNLDLSDWCSKRLSSVVNSFKNNSELGEAVACFLFSVGKQLLPPLFTDILPKEFDKVTYYELVQYLISHLTTEASAFLEQQGIVLIWIEQALRDYDLKVRDLQQGAVLMLCEVWGNFAKYFAKQEELANAMLGMLNKAAREKNFALRVSCLGSMFRLLTMFFHSKSSYAPILYKSLSLVLLEQFNNPRMREFLLENFINIIEEIPSIPVGMLLEPLLKQVHATDFFSFSTVDFDFFIAVARHPRLEVPDAVFLLDTLSKIMLNDFIYAKAAEIPLILISGRFLEFKPVEEFLMKFLSLAFKALVNAAKPEPLQHMKTGEMEELQSNNYFKNLLLNLCDRLIKLENEDFNRQVKDCLLNTNYEIKKVTGHNLKGLALVLNLLGNGQSLIHNFEVSRNSAIVPYKQAMTAYSESNGSLKHFKNRAIEDIQRIQSRRNIQDSRERTMSEKRKVLETRKKDSLKKMVDARHIELGISSKATILKENSAKKSTSYINIEEETAFDQELIFTLLKNYKKATAMMFNDYANSGYQKEFINKNSFENAKEAKQSLREGEAIKLLRDHRISKDMLSSEEIKNIYMFITGKFKTHTFDYEMFLNLLYQVSLKVFSVSPRDLRQFPSVVSLKTLIEMFIRNNPKLNSEKEPDMMKLLNKKLEEDENTVMPEGYKRVKEKTIDVTYELPEAVETPDSFKIVLEMLDDICKEAVGIHILEPVVYIKETYKAQKVLTKPIIVESSNKLQVPTNKAVYKAFPLPTYLNLTPNIKLEYSKLKSSYNNELLFACANCLDDLLHSVHSASPILISRNPKPAGTIPNKIIMSKLLIREQELHDKEIAEINRQRRIRELGQEMNRLKKVKEDHERYQSEENAREFRKQKEKERKLKEIYQRSKEERDRLIKEFHVKKFDDELKRKQEEENKIKKIEEKRKQNRKYLDSLRSQSEKSVDRSKSFRVLDSLGILKEDFENASRERAVIRLINSYKASFTLITKHYNKGGLEINVSLNSALVFASHFNLVPCILQGEVLRQIFQSVTKLKPNQTGLDVDDFSQFLLRAAIVSKDKLENELARSLESYDSQLRALLKWMKIPRESHKMAEFLKALDRQLHSVNPRDKAKMKNSMLEQISSSIDKKYY